MIEEVREKMKGNTTTTLFNKVQQSVYKMVEIDSFPRFVKSEGNFLLGIALFKLP